ncbi:ATP-dependent helicase HrpB [Thiomicrorhabdus sp.]|uniref:ATP-dependent helicase HrpB n=1 Tax=Thiomicrorhabdus sp. TaxID=2039724 RepID=UPI0029C7B55C|nr:ATP-dependent helicase HrpB [Thiomicrorhabdus sp.]
MTLSEKQRLPIEAILPELEQVLLGTEQVILQAEPGAGKSTQVPLAMLAAPQFAGKKLLMLEPRRLAVKNLANYLASCLGEKAGQTIGYHLRNERKASDKTRLLIVTEGILTRYIQADPELNDYALVIFDEFHERSIHADLGLTLLLDVQEALRDDLKCLIMSATLDSEALQNFLPSSKILFCPGRSFPVKVLYRDQPLTVVLKEALQTLQGSAFDDILIFLPGVREIQEAMQACRENIAGDWLALPLHGQLPPEEQEKVFQPAQQTKVIFSTNIAETSLTIEGIGAVIDSGRMKVMEYDPSSAMTRLQTRWISQASATQRAGRAGRLQAGICYRLWSESRQNSLAGQDKEEILQADLTSLCMELALWGVKNPHELRWLTAPPEAHFATAKALLSELGLLDEQGSLSEDGQQAMQMGIEPRLARMLLQAQRIGQVELGCDLAACLSERDFLIDADSADITVRLQVLQDFLLNGHKGIKGLKVRFSVLQNVVKLRRRLRVLLKLNKDDMGRHVEYASAGLLLAFAYPDRIAKQRDQRSGEYRMSNGKSCNLNEADTLRTESYLSIADLNGDRRSGRVFLAAAVEESELLNYFPVHNEAVYRYLPKERRLQARQATLLGKLVIREEPLESVDNKALKRCLMQAVSEDLALLPWNRRSENLIERAQWLAQFSGYEALTRFSKSNLCKTLDAWLEPFWNRVASVADLQKIELFNALYYSMSTEEQQGLQKGAPENYPAPNGKVYPIIYSGELAKVALPLQAVFGETTSPKLAGGQAVLAFELLSPAARPIQITSDLAYFWDNSYKDVAKEMRGRYPKHRWPDNPLEEKAGSSIKKFY